MRTRPLINPCNQQGIVDSGITSLVDLAAVATSNLRAGAVRVWVLEADGTSQIWHLEVSTADTVEGSIQRPNDYNPARPLVWFKASS